MQYETNIYYLNENSNIKLLQAFNLICKIHVYIGWWGFGRVLTGSENQGSSG